MRNHAWMAAALLLAAAAAGCKHEDTWVPRSRTPGVDGEPAEQEPAGGAPKEQPKEQTKAWSSFPAGEEPLLGTGAADFAEFCSRTAAAPRAGSVGCLPPVMYDADHRGPWVPELGTGIADAAAGEVRLRGFRGSVLDSSEMGIRLSEVNLERVTLSTLEAVAGAGDRIGVDVVIFGTLRRDKDPGTPFLQVIRVDLAAYSFLSSSVVARAKFELRSDRAENKRAYAAARSESLWMPGTAWQVPSPEKGFDEELRVATGILARRVVKSIDLEKVRGAVYVPPADTGLFVRSVARLRAAQSAFAMEYEKRSKDALKGESPLDIEKPLTLNGVEFRNLQAAYSYLAALREQLLSTESARFAGTVSAMAAEALRPIVSPRTVILDAGFTKGSDLQLLEGDLATGGLARSLRAREALRDQGVEIVVAPRIERLGGNFALRAEVFDLRNPNLMASASVRIEPRYSAELAQQLEVEGGAAPIEDLPAVERNAWEKVNEKVVSGVVLLTGKRGGAEVQGTGFVVSAAGHILTNAHVAAAMEGGGTVTFSGGATAAFRPVREDPFWDLAVLKVDAVPDGTFVFRFADPARAKVGAEVAVVGNPKGTQGWVLAPGHLSSIREKVMTTGERPSFMYTCATRGGNSGSPVLLQDGTVVAVHSAGMVGDVKAQNGYQVVTDRGTVFSELTGFALGAPGPEAEKLVSSVAGAAR